MKNRRDIADYKYIKVLTVGRYLHVAFNPPNDFRSGALGGKRIKNAKSWFRRFIRRWHCSEMEPVTTNLALLRTSPEALEATVELDRRLALIFDSPVSARAMRKVLKITKEEEVYWLKEGLLTPKARQRVRTKSSAFSVPVYDAEFVTTLEHQPEIIAHWRLQFAKQHPKVAV